LHLARCRVGSRAIVATRRLLRVVSPKRGVSTPILKYSSPGESLDDVLGTASPSDKAFLSASFKVTNCYAHREQLILVRIRVGGIR